MVSLEQFAGVSPSVVGAVEVVEDEVGVRHVGAAAQRKNAHIAIPRGNWCLGVVPLQPVVVQVVRGGHVCPAVHEHVGHGCNGHLCAVDDDCLIRGRGVHRQRTRQRGQEQQDCATQEHGTRLQLVVARHSC